MLTTAEFDPAALDVRPPRWLNRDDFVCPFCGSVHVAAVGRHRCPQCSLEDTPATRAAAKSRVGPWYLLRDANVAARGMTFQTLAALVQRNLVTPESIVRGPGTYQLWRWAGKVKGLSREMGFCYTCGESVGTTAETCPHCNRSQVPSLDGEAALEPEATHTPVAAPLPAAPRYSAPRTNDGGSRRTIAGQKFVPRERDPRDVVPAPEPTLFESLAPAGAPRRLPREDLLTPTDVAKAFSLSFDFSGNPHSTGPSEVALYPWRETLTRAAKPMKIAAVVLLVLAAAVTESMVVPRLLAARSSTVAWVETHVHHASDGSIQTPAAATELTSAATARFTEPAPALVATVAIAPPAAPPAAPQPVLAEPTPAPSPADDVRQLWAAALDAESHRDFAAAVHDYERIRSLPDNTWPAGLSTRIQLARQEQVAGTY